MMEVLAIGAACLSLYYCAVILFLRGGLSRLTAQPVTDGSTQNYSVVIAAHNEEATIEHCLHNVFSQTIAPHRYEVIVVDDRSTDATLEKVKVLMVQHPNLSTVTITKTEAGFSPKKYAVIQGIAAAHNEIIVVTDADCRVQPTWLTIIGAYFTPDTGIVQGITTYEYVPGMNRLFYGIQALDFLSHGIVAAAAIGKNFPINSNANNLAFRKKAYDDVGGYGAAGSVVSGDDDLLLQRLWRNKSWNIRYMADNNGSVITFPALTVKDMFEQRKRWGSKTVHYNTQQVVFLGGIFCFYVLLLCMCAAGCFFPTVLLIAAGMMLVKLAGELMLLVPGAKIFNKKELLTYCLPGSIFQLLMVISAVFMGVFGKFGWKGQTFRRTVISK